MQAAAAGPAWLLMLALFGAPLNAPLSLPPLPEDPMLAKLAPEQCVWYMSLAGVDKPNPASKNKVEQLLAEEDVQRFIHEIGAKVKVAFANATPTDPLRKTLGEEGVKLFETLITRPTCAYLASVQAGPRGPTIRAGLAVNLGDDVAKTKVSLEKIEKAIATLQPEAKRPAADGDWHTLPTPPDAPVVQWGIKDKYLIVGIGEGEAEVLWGRSRKSAPEWLTKLRAQLPVERPAMIQYTNVQTVIALTKTALQSSGQLERGDAIFAALGVTNVMSIASVSGLEKEGYVSRSLLAIDGEPAGLLSLLATKSLDPSALDPIPADANLAVAARLDPAKTFDVLLNSLELIEHAAPASVEQGIQQFAQTTAVNFKTDVIDSLGDTWCVYNSPGDGGFVFTGVTLVATIRDRNKLLQANDRLIGFAQGMMAQQQQALMANDAPGRKPRGVTIADCQYRGQKIHFVNFIGAESPVAPAWCITDKQFVVALYPQMIKSFLDRQAGGSNQPAGARPLASLPEISQLFSSGSGPVMLTYQDTPNSFKLFYPFVQMFAQIAFSELQRQGVDLNISILPSERVIEPHLTPSISTVQATKEGIRFESRGSVSVGAGMMPIAVAMLLPATQAARQAATRTQSMNNMKQIALAMLNFEEVKKTFPPAFVASKDGKPLLSWRVLILPFIEEQALFQQFKLDEPWDSENNKKLIEKMPKIYAAPGSKVAGEFKTVYQTIRAADSAFPGARGMKLAGITDGTSRTIMAVEVSDDKAVIWTKPDDFEVDPNNPVAGLVGMQNNLFLAVFCDGHVEATAEGIDAGVLKAMISRNGGETIPLP